MGILKLSVKLTLSCLGRIVLFVCLTALLSFIAGLSGSYLLYGDKAIPPVTVAIVDEDNSFESRMLLNYLEDFEEYRSILGFRQEDRETAERLLENGELSAVIFLPPNFIAGVLEGENSPFTITLSGKYPLKSAVIRLFADVYADMLRTGQIGVYTALDAASRYGDATQYAGMYRVSNMRFVSAMLGRATMQEEKLLSPTGSGGIALHYGASAFVFLILLGSILFLDVWTKAASRPVLLRMRALGSGPVSPGLAYLAGAALPFAAACLLLGVGICAANLFLNLGLSASPALFFCLLLLILCSASFLLAVSRLFRGGAGGSVFVFFYSAVCLFLSGGILPSAYLSPLLRTLGSLTPHFWLSRLLVGSLGGTADLSAAAMAAAFTACFALIGLVGVERGGRVGKTL